MPLGFPGGVTIVNVLEAKFTGEPATTPASVSLGHVDGVGRGEHVGRGALIELGHQIGGPGEVERDLGCGVIGFEPGAQFGERLLQRRRREHGDLGGGRRLRALG